MATFSNQDNSLRILAVIVDGKTIYYDVKLTLDFSSGEFQLLRAYTELSLAVRIDEPFQLGIGQRAMLKDSDFSIILKSVSNDSRCPVDVQCIWAGEVQVSLSVSEYDQYEDIGLTLSGGTKPSSVTHNLEHYSLELRSVSPYPTLLTSIAEPYEVELVIHSKQ